jgi:hypothetical protein
MVDIALIQSAAVAGRGIGDHQTDPSFVPLLLLITSAAIFFRVSELACTPAVPARARSNGIPDVGAMN